MRICNMDGGLGQQAVQYIFSRYLEETTGEDVYIDDSEFDITADVVASNKATQPDVNLSWVHNGYELEYVFPNLKKPKRLSQYFEPGEWAEMINVSSEWYRKAHSFEPDRQYACIAQFLYKNGKSNLKMCAEYDFPIVRDFEGEKIFTDSAMFNPDVATIPSKDWIYYFGYWKHPKWFYSYEDILRREMTFPPIADVRNKNYARLINDTLSVGVHIRRGDYTKAGYAYPLEYHKHDISAIREVMPTATWFIFSDDIPWCKNNHMALNLPPPQNGEVYFIEGNRDFKNNYIDVQLMSMCKVLLGGNSVFSFLAGILQDRNLLFHHTNAPWFSINSMIG